MAAHSRRRLQTEAAKAWMRRRGERIERSFAHLYETGGMRRVHLRGKNNLAKRLLIYAAAFNLSLILRQMLGTGTARQAADRSLRFVCASCASCMRQTAIHWLLDPAGLRPGWLIRRVAAINCGAAKARLCPRADRRTYSARRYQVLEIGGSNPLQERRVRQGPLPCPPTRAAPPPPGPPS